jgi:hypothetical protein
LYPSNAYAVADDNRYADAVTDANGDTYTLVDTALSGTLLGWVVWLPASSRR